MRDRFQTYENIRAFLYITVRNNCLEYIKAQQAYAVRCCINNDKYENAFFIRFGVNSPSMTLAQISSDINQEITSQLEKYNCTGGECRYQPLSSVALTGIKEDGKHIIIWQTNPRLGYLLWLYVDQLPDDGGVTVTIKLPDQFTYRLISNAAIAQDAKQIEKKQHEEILHAQKEKLEALKLQTEKYGITFAEKVANGLQKGGWVAYNHRDYCGMGLEFREGVYKYAEVYDGYLTEYSSLQWSSKEAFVAWLADQSDASLARLEEKDDWYWGNQTINRQRLQPIAYKGR